MQELRILIIFFLGGYLAGSYYMAVLRKLKKDFEDKTPKLLGLFGKLVILPGRLILEYVIFVEKVGKRIFYGEKRDQTDNLQSK